MTSINKNQGISGEKLSGKSEGDSLSVADNLMAESSGRVLSNIP
jgi:hypothetical protein